jgi:hypothetical protein
MISLEMTAYNVVMGGIVVLCVLTACHLINGIIASCFVFLKSPGRYHLLLYNARDVVVSNGLQCSHSCSVCVCVYV